MLVDEMPRSFVKKNNSYSHCPLKKRPVHVMLYEEEPEIVKGKHQLNKKKNITKKLFLTPKLFSVEEKKKN